MPTLNGVSIELHTQQGPSHGGPIEEFTPCEPELCDSPNRFIPRVYETSTRTVSVFIPVFPSQQFWLVYSAEPPPSSPTDLSGPQNPFAPRSSTSTSLKKE